MADQAYIANNYSVKLIDLGDGTYSEAISIATQKYGTVLTVHATVSATSTSSELNLTGYNAMLVSANISGSGTWNISALGRFDTAGTVMNIYDNNDNKLTTGDVTVSRMRLFTAIPPLVTIVATEVVDGATCTVRVQPLNI